MNEHYDSSRIDIKCKKKNNNNDDEMCKCICERQRRTQCNINVTIIIEVMFSIHSILFVRHTCIAHISAYYVACIARVLPCRVCALVIVAVIMIIFIEALSFFFLTYVTITQISWLPVYSLSHTH